MVAAVVALTLGSVTAQAGDQVVAYQIDTAHTGGQPTDTLAPPFTQIWSVDLGGAVSYPLIANGVTYVTVADAGYGTRLYALNLSTGAAIWGPIELGGPYNFSAAAYDAGRVYAINFSGTLQAFDASTGVALWSTQLPGQYAFTSPPTAVNGLVYVGGAGSGGTVYGVGEADGKVKWTASVANGDHSSPAVTGGGVYVSYACDQAYDLDAATGAQVWHHTSSCAGGGGKTPTRYGGRVYIRDQYSGNLVLDAASGDQVGTFPITGNGAVPIPAFSGSRGFFFDNAALHGVDLATNTTLWSFSGDGSLSSAPIVVGQYVYEASSLGNLYVLDPASGATVFSTNIGSGVAHPDEQNAMQTTGLGAGEGVLLVPAGSRLMALSSAVTVLPASLSFPRTPLGSSSTQSVTVTNHGSAVSITGVSVTGDFTAPNTCPPSLPAGASCTMNVSFTPSTLGTLSGNLTITDSASAAPHTVPLSGLGGVGPADHVVLSPRDATTTAGVAQTYSVRAFDAAGNDLGDVTPQSTVTLLSQSASTPIACPQAACSTTWATQPNYLDTVTASYTPAGGTALSDATTLTVLPGAATHLSIQQLNASTPAGVRVRYYLFPRDQYENATGEVSASAQFTITAPARCQAYYCSSTVTGTYLVGATYGGMSTTTNLTVVPDVPTTLTLSPAYATVTVGTGQAYSAQAYDRWGNGIGDETTSTAFSLPGGSCAANVCSSTTATATGTQATVSATWKPPFYAAITGTAQITIVHGPVSTLTLSGPTSTSGGSPVSIKVEAADAYGNDAGDATGQAAFSIAPDGSCQANSCTATKTGSHTVTATYQSVSGTFAFNVTPAAAATLQLAPATATIRIGGSQAYTAEAFDQYGNDAGDVTSQTSFTIAGAACAGNSCSSASAAPNGIEVDGTYQAAGGKATLTVLPVAVVVDQVTATPVSPNSSIQFSDTIRVSARVTVASTAFGPIDGQVIFATDYVGRFASVTFPAGVNSAIVSADYPLNSESTPGGAGVYPFVANFLSYSPNYASALSASTSLTVLREGATAAFTAPSYVSDRAFPALAVTVDQRDPGGDTQYIDYGVVATWARFDVYAPGKAVPQQTGYAQLKNAANWSTTGLGTAQLVLAKPLADGVYEVVAGIVANSTSAQGNSSTYLATDTARAYLTSAPSTGIFAAGAGYIATDSTSNIGSRRGQFGFFGKPGKTPTGVVAYTYRMRMDIGGGTLRDVDVEVTSTSITTLTLKSAGTGGTVLVRGAFAVRYLDAVTLADYTTFDFSGGTYELNSTDAGTSGDRYQLLLKRPDGTAFHSSSSSQLPVAGGGITVKSSE